MYRYFLVKDKDLPKLEDHYGVWNTIDLGSHGNSGKGWHVLVMYSLDYEPSSDWHRLPKIVDHKTPIKAKIDHKLFADLGVTGDETTFELTEMLGEILPSMAHP